jgi:hypothetical protein
MRSARGQGTVEYVGVLLLVAVLLGAVAGGFGLPRLTAQIASSITRAFLGEIGVGEPATATVASQPSADDRAAFARAVDPAVSPDDRPSLRDVRLELIRTHGAAGGQAVYRELVLADLRAAVPGLAAPTRFATVTPEWRQAVVEGRYIPIAAEHSLAPPRGDDPGEVETPVSAPNAHVVTVSEADQVLDRALHPGISNMGIALDLLSVLPWGGLARTATTAVRIGARVAKGARAVGRGVSALSNGATIGRDALELSAPGADASPAGAREGDEIVSWLADRCPAGGGIARQVVRMAIVRDGVAILEGIRWPDSRSPAWSTDPTPDEGCS